MFERMKAASVAEAVSCWLFSNAAAVRSTGPGALLSASRSRSFSSANWRVSLSISAHCAVIVWFSVSMVTS